MKRYMFIFLWIFLGANCSIDTSLASLDVSMDLLASTVSFTSSQKKKKEQEQKKQDTFVSDFIKSEFGKKVYQKMKQETKNNLQAALKDFRIGLEYGPEKKLLKNQLEYIANNNLSEEEIKKYLLGNKKEGVVSPEKQTTLKNKFDGIKKDLQGFGAGNSNLTNLKTDLFKIILGEGLGDQKLFAKNKGACLKILNKLEKITNASSKDLVLVCTYILAASPELAGMVVELLQKQEVSEQEIHNLILTIYDLLYIRLDVFKDTLPDSNKNKAACFDLSLVLGYPVVLSAYIHGLKERNEANKLSDDEKTFLNKFDTKENEFFKLAETAQCKGIDIKKVKGIIKWDDRRAWCKRDIYTKNPKEINLFRLNNKRYLPENATNGKICGSRRGKDENKKSFEIKSETVCYLCFDSELQTIAQAIKSFNKETNQESSFYTFLRLLEKQAIINAIDGFYRNIHNPNVCPVCLYNDLQFVDKIDFETIKKFLGNDSLVQSALNKMDDIEKKMKFAKTYGPFITYKNKANNWRKQIEKCIDDGDFFYEPDMAKNLLKNAEKKAKENMTDVAKILEEKSLLFLQRANDYKYVLAE